MLRRLTSHVQPSRPPRVTSSHFRRALRTTAPSRASEVDEPVSEANDAQVEGEQDNEAGKDEQLSDPLDPSRGATGLQYKAFMATVAAKLKVARPMARLGSSQSPFPMNPSFRPPVPISDFQRQHMWNSFREGGDVRTLARKYQLSLKRTDAILRLKAMEEDWKKGIPLQTGFTTGMEWILGVPKDSAVDAVISGKERRQGRTDPDIADELEEKENRDAQRQRYVRMYWEPVPEDGSDSLVPSSIAMAKATAEKHSKAAKALLSDPSLNPKIPVSSKLRRPPAKQTISAPGRAPIRFIDVGTKFMDVRERLRRISAARRRSTHNARMGDTRLIKLGHFKTLRKRKEDQLKRQLVKVEERTKTTDKVKKIEKAPVPPPSAGTKPVPSAEA